MTVQRQFNQRRDDAFLATRAGVVRRQFGCIFDDPMKLVATRIDYDETDIGKFKATVSYHEGDGADKMGQSADIIVYLDVNGRRLPEDAPTISAEGVTRARHLLRRILDETDERAH